VDYADAECILLEDRGNEEGQIQHQIGRRGSMQCLLCDGIRILSEVFQTTKSGTQSVRESDSRTWEHMQFEGASEDVRSQGEFYSIRRRRGMYTTPSPSTEEGGQLCSAVDFIAHEHHEGGRVGYRRHCEYRLTTIRGENKNIYMFALCVALVGLGYFQEVQLCFLIVGHTHEDID
jgi:hypothetical protein